MSILHVFVTFILYWWSVFGTFSYFVSILHLPTYDAYKWQLVSVLRNVNLFKFKRCIQMNLLRIKWLVYWICWIFYLVFCLFVPVYYFTVIIIVCKFYRIFFIAILYSMWFMKCVTLVCVSSCPIYVEYDYKYIFMFVFYRIGCVVFGFVNTPHWYLPV